jgi:putative tricarboxylic transport membrane protein
MIMRLSMQSLKFNVFVATLIVACTSIHVLAQEGWKPTKNIEVIVGTSAGGAADHSARVLQQLLQRIAGSSSMVVNKPGASYIASFTYLNQQAGDGHYIAISPINLITNRIVGLGGANPEDITPLAQLISDYHVFSVRSESPIKSGNELIERLRKDPGSLSIAVSPGLGAANHFATGTILKAAGVDIKRLKIVAFASGGESLTSALGGHTDLLVSATPAVTPLIEAGKMRAIAITSAQRLSGVVATVPTWKEQGVDATFSNWRGVIGPRNLPPAQVTYWDGALRKVTQTEEWKKDLRLNNQEPNYMNSQESKTFLNTQSKQLSALLADLGLAKNPGK